jgi:UTP--glucose-1-phosphate uridylyltransferase
MQIKRAIITAAGLGTRLLPMSKELPKEMLPIYARKKLGKLLLKPLLQALFEQLYRFGIREFCFVVGRGKRAIEDHFTPDQDYIDKLNSKGKTSLASEMASFYGMVESSTIMWVNQPEPKGFGHAVLMAKPFIGNEPFIVCAGDTYIISKNNKFINIMAETHFRRNSEATLLLQKITNPKQYGVAIIEKYEHNACRVLRVVEKPSIPPSNLAIMPIYIFNPTIMDILENLKPGVGTEIQLTDAIQKLIDQRCKVQAVLLDKDELRLDIGTPETYWKAVKASYEYCTGAIKRV